MNDKAEEKAADSPSELPNPSTVTKSELYSASHTVEKVKSEGKKLQAIPGTESAILVPDDFSVQDIEAHLPQPVRIRKKLQFFSANDFIAYINRFKNDDSTIYLAPKVENNASVATVIFDDNGNGNPQRGEHSAQLIFRTSWQYEALKVLCNPSLLPQSDFALAVRDIAKYAESIQAADLLELARTLQLSSKGDFKNFEDDFSGSVDFRFDLKVTATSAQTAERKVPVPREIDWSLPVLLGGNDRLIKTELLYRIPQSAGDPVRMGLKFVGEKEMLHGLTLALQEQLGAETGLMAIIAA